MEDRRLIAIALYAHQLILTPHCMHVCSLPDVAQSSGPYVDPNTGSLVLTEATSENSGTYICTGSNVYGTASVSTEIEIVRVKGMPDNRSITKSMGCRDRHTSV